MSFLDIAQKRYTTKKYDSSKKIDEHTIEKLKEILRLSPSSINSQPWKFTFVADEEIKSRLAEFSLGNREKVLDASHIVIFSVVKDAEAFENNKLKLLPEYTTTYYNRVLKPRGDEQIMTWLTSQVYLSLGFFLSATATLGIDSTPMEGINTKEYDAILKDDNYKTLFAVAIGYRDKEDENQPSLNPKFRLDAEDVIRSI
ncbi:MAG TPA: NAD(P)H-dependent oxidoreductase [Fermentimonas caenicola]|jgi:nitroreductase/dihydropteridine reductase|uniref:Putative 6,7-dihydropteridine reductase n=1 Tax=Fermentimonas caenicola TaxID=1562970 RepID=A0A098C1M6_9BACT|nr:MULTISPECIES: nitroreductase family protein [Lascolabacillus]MBP6176319.1 nitroreductase family protein [Fermentimonas sp.]MDI9625618.1 nitroreductase family protein [Bacteroidota bacterium]TAH62309.1 MAG: NAD(P)H-dependent oxidoreductase [Fermentimonas caenicola]MBP6197049.1 nitroreductase family protein [Fermentimonas sp.]MDD2607277.1 nitroreductase family protein [Lascolabacillus sp.]